MGNEPAWSGAERTYLGRPRPSRYNNYEPAHRGGEIRQRIDNIRNKITYADPTMARKREQKELVKKQIKDRKLRILKSNTLNDDAQGFKGIEYGDGKKK